jgi:hypothetical protein
MRRSAMAVAVLLSTLGCGAGGPSRRGAGSYAQAVDSATATCERTPAYCARVAGEETVVPGGRVAPVLAAEKAWEALEEATRKHIEDILVECARQADARVNQQEFGGRHPTAEECKQQVGGTRENPVTRSMRLGSAKHALALQCTKDELGRTIPGRFSLEQRYRLHPETRHLERIRPERELEMLRNGGKDLAGSVVPDVVITTGEPLQVQRVYDFKFPCPGSNPAEWRKYPPGNPLQVADQGKAYQRVFDVSPSRVTPRRVIE